jgi:hypothetical protein
VAKDPQLAVKRSPSSNGISITRFIRYLVMMYDLS